MRLRDPYLWQVLYSSFRTVRTETSTTPTPLTIEQVRSIARSIDHLGAKA